jgi:diguanylate cyclase (GGDEF)-like protein
LAALLDVSLKDLPEPDEIEERARGFVEELSVATEAEFAAVCQKNQELEEQTHVDALTSIANRRAFDERLSAELERIRRYDRPISILMADIDRFKQVNDRFGHVIGDTVLKDVAQRMQSALRGCDFLARYGGEEFVVIAAETDLDGAARLAERVRRAVEMAEPNQPGTPRVTISVGVTAALAPHGKIEPQDLVAAADGALYDAKRAGRNRCCTTVFEAKPG